MSLRRPAALLLLLAATLAAATQPAPPTPPHLLAALDIATHIQSADNEYAHKDCFIHWPGVDGAAKFANRTDCSDFLNLLLEHTYAFTNKDFKSLTGVNRPTAAEWYDAATTGTAKTLLTVVPHLDAALPGDLILIKYPPGEEDTGHVMLFAALPTLRTASAPIQPDTRQWEVPVVDSSKSGHGTTDTRHNPDATFSRGVGKGILRLYTNPDNTLAGYSWSTQKVSKFIPITDHAILLAHLIPPPQPAAAH